MEMDYCCALLKASSTTSIRNIINHQFSSYSIVAMKMTIETLKKEVCDLHGLILMSTSLSSQSKNRNYERMGFALQQYSNWIGYLHAMSASLSHDTLLGTLLLSFSGTPFAAFLLTEMDSKYKVVVYASVYRLKPGINQVLHCHSF